MKINNTIYLDYSDVLIKPQNTKLYSRKDVNLIRKIYFPISKQYWEGVPIIAANMDTIGTYEVYKELSKNKMITCFHKFYTPEDFETMELDPNYFMISTGINENDLLRLQSITEKIEVKFICIDVANGYMETLIEFCIKIRELFPNKIIIAGNIVCENKTKELIKYGKVDIVKVGIGSGCFDENVKILLANGSYEKIKNIKEGTKVINKLGNPVKVIRNIYKGKREVIKIQSDTYNEITNVTPDHNFWIGDLNHLSINTIKKSSVNKLLKNKDKFKWEEINKVITNKQYGCLPKNINWDLKEEMYLDLYDKSMNYKYDDIYIYINDKRYNRFVLLTNNFGFIIGQFIYNHYYNIIKNINNYIIENKIHEILNLHEIFIKNIFVSIQTENDILNRYLNKNKDFIEGLYKGLINIKENEFIKNIYQINIKKYPNNIINIIYFCILSLGYNFKVNTIKNKILINKSYNDNMYSLSKITKTGENEISKTEENEISKTEENEMNKKLVDTYDLEVDSECHSFIANNLIVHNSACLTRTQTGIGVPQLSAIDECSEKAHQLNSYIIGDGGITCAGDISKGFGAGSDFIMIGGLFSGHDENPGEIIEENNKKYKIFYGMSSKTSMEKNYGKMDTYRSSEGRSCKIPYKGSIDNTIQDLLGGVRSTCTYIGCKNIEDFSSKCNFIRVNNQLNKVYDKYNY